MAGVETTFSGAVCAQGNTRFAIALGPTIAGTYVVHAYYSDTELGQPATLTVVAGLHLSTEVFQRCLPAALPPRHRARYCRAHSLLTAHAASSHIAQSRVKRANRQGLRHCTHLDLSSSVRLAIAI